MFIELTEYLLCPNGHDPEYCVAVPVRMEGRHVVEGVVGCPACKAEFAISGGVLQLHGGSPPADESIRKAPPDPVPDAASVHTLLGLDGPGGYVVLVGAVAVLADQLQELLPDVHLICINSPGETRPGGAVSLIESPAGMGLRDAMARGVVVGGELDPAWTDEALRVVLPGRHAVVLRGSVKVPRGAEVLALSQDISVFRKLRNMPQSS